MRASVALREPPVRRSRTARRGGHGDRADHHRAHGLLIPRNDV